MALKLVAVLLVTGVGIAVGDGNEFDGVDCGVAAKPPGREAGKADNGKSKGEKGNSRSPGYADGVGSLRSGRAIAAGPASPSGQVATGRYELRREFGGWRLVFDGSERFLAESKGLGYVAVLLDRPGESLHAAELANRAFGDAVVEQRNIAGDDRETAQGMAEARRRCQAVIDDPGANEVEREEARMELEEIVDWARRHLRGTEAGEQRQVRAIRQAIRRLLDGLRRARDGSRAPDLVLRGFGEHLQRFLWEPSGRGGQRGRSRVEGGMAGRFVYERPPGVWWEG